MNNVALSWYHCINNNCHSITRYITVNSLKFRIHSPITANENLQREKLNGRWKFFDNRQLNYEKLMYVLATFSSPEWSKCYRQPISHALQEQPASRSKPDLIQQNNKNRCSNCCKVNYFGSAARTTTSHHFKKEITESEQ